MYPVVIISYNRPDYLATTLRSIKAAMAEDDWKDEDVFLFQDGAFSEHFESVKCSQDLVNQCCEIFANFFPKGAIHRSDINLGIALNIARAENHIFQNTNFDFAVFFEDDLLVSKRYFKVMRKLIDLAVSDRRIGMVAAYGCNAREEIQGQIDGRNHVGAMHHNWGYAIGKQQWSELKLLTDPYFQSLKKRDYSDRPYIAALKLYNDCKLPALASNQDIFKNVCLYSLGKIRVTSRTVNAENIGQIGEHFSPGLIQSLGLEKPHIYMNDGPEEFFEPLSDGDYFSIRKEHYDNFIENRVDPYYLIYHGAHYYYRDIDQIDLAELNYESNGFALVCPTGIFHDFWVSSEMMIEIKSESIITTLRIQGQQSNIAASRKDQRLLVYIDNTVVKNVLLAEISDLVEIDISHLCKCVVEVKLLSRACPSPQSQGYGEDRRPIVWNFSFLQIEGDNNCLLLTQQIIKELMDKAAIKIRNLV